MEDTNWLLLSIIFLLVIQIDFKKLNLMQKIAVIVAFSSALFIVIN